MQFAVVWNDASNAQFVCCVMNCFTTGIPRTTFVKYDIHNTSVHMLIGRNVKHYVLLLYIIAI